MAQQALTSAWYISGNSTSGTGYYAVSPWATSAYSVGKIIRQLFPPILGNERCYVCTSAGNTSGVEPGWTSGSTVTQGAIVVDNTVTWCECTGQASVNGDLANTFRWAAVKGSVTSATTGITLKDASNNLFINTTSGSFAGGEPSWNTTVGNTTTDGTAVWTCFANGTTSAWGAPHARTPNCNTATWARAGDTEFVADNHAESTSGAAFVFSFPGTGAAPNTMLCVDHAASVPPGTSNLKSTATVSGTSNGLGFNINGGVAYLYGITFQGASGLIFSTAQNSALTFDTCGMTITGGTGRTITFGTQGGGSAGANSVILNNTIFTNNVAGTTIVFNSGRFLWRNTPNAVQGSSATTLMSVAGGSTHNKVTLQGVDLSLLGSGSTIIGIGNNCTGSFLLQDCKLGAGVSITGGSIPSPGGTEVEMVNCDSGNTNYRFYRQNYQATETSETTIVRTGGASDGVTPMARKVVTTANSKWYAPYKTDWIEYWHNTSGIAVSPSIAIVNNSLLTLTNADAWLEVESMTSAGYPLGKFFNDSIANILTSASAQSADNASVWGGGLTSAVQQTLSCTLTPTSFGVLRARVCVARPSLTCWYDPLLQNA